MEKKDNKGDYYFGSKPVLERAEDENEFEGSLTTSTELQNLAFIHEIPSTCWRAILLDVLNKGTFKVTEENFETGELQFTSSKEIYNTNPRLFRGDPIWKMGTEAAQYKGWNWTGDRYVSVWEIIGIEDLQELVAIFMVEAQRLGLTMNIQLNVMTQDLVHLDHIHTWKQLWDEATNGQYHDIDATIAPSNGPEKVFSFRYGYRNMSRVWFAKREKLHHWYVVLYGEY